MSDNVQYAALPTTSQLELRVETGQYPPHTPLPQGQQPQVIPPVQRRITHILTSWSETWKPLIIPIGTLCLGVLLASMHHVFNHELAKDGKTVYNSLI